MYSAGVNIKEVNKIKAFKKDKRIRIGFFSILKSIKGQIYC